MWLKGKCSNSGQMEQPAQTYHSTWMAHWTRSCGEGARSFNQPSDVLGKKENINDTSRQLEIAMANSCNPTKVIDIGTSKSEIDNKRMELMVSSMRNKDIIAETSKPVKSNQASINVESIHPGNKQGILSDSAGGLCSDSQVQLQYSQLPHKDFYDNIFDSEEKTGERSKGLCFQALLAEPLKSNNHLQNSSKSSEKNGGSDKLCNMFNTSGMFQSSFDEVETTRICTTVDSVVGLSGKHSKFSQTTQSLLITKKIDSNLFKCSDFGRHSFSTVNPSSHHGVKPRNLHSRFTYSELQEEKSRKSRGIYELTKLASVEEKSIYELTKLASVEEENVEDAAFTDSELQEKSRGIYELTKLASVGEKSIYELTKLASVEEENVEDAANFKDPRDRKGKGKGKGKRVAHDSELSAETAIMDLANYEKTQLHGVNSSPHVKVIKLGSSTTPRPAVSFGGEENRPGQHKIKLPDINLEALASSTDEQTLVYEEPITSRTQSLDKETVLSHAEHVNPLESVNDLHGSLKPEPGGRWLKRLKLNDSASYSIGKKSSDCIEKSHHERGNLSLKRFLEDSMALASKNHGKEPMVVDEATTLKIRGESSYIDSAKKDKDVLLSKSWIKRWCHHEETPKKNPNAEIGGGESRNSNLLFEDTKKKQFPSIGAMALMAKTVNCVETYDIRNRGAVTVWSTKGF